MSLINKMLQDLDARGSPRDGAVPLDVKPVALDARRLPPRRIAAITAALLVLALGVTAWVVLPLKGKTFDGQPVAVPAPVVAATPAAPQPQPQSPPEPQSQPEAVTVVEVANPPALAGRAPVEKPQREKDVPAATRQAAAPARAPLASAAAPGPTEEQLAATTTTWAVASERARAEELRLAARWRAEEARIAALPRGERAAARERVRAQQARAAVRTQADAAFVAALRRKEEAAGAPSAPLAAASPAGPKGLGRVETPAQGAENSYRRALAALQDGRVAEAIAGLQATLRAQPAHEAARQTLVSLLIENNRSDEAVLQLQQALGLDPRQPALAMLLARLQIERGRSGIETLLRTLPYATGNGDYHAFLAGALARQSRHGEAVEQYQAALRSVPGNAVWWMGLGMSLQADKRNAEALDAFRQARALGSLSAELQGFVERKISQLAR